VGLLFRDANFRENIENNLALDFQFSRQIVNSNFTHPPLSPFPKLLAAHWLPHRLLSGAHLFHYPPKVA
jgi:hypothetical protein